MIQSVSFSGKSIHIQQVVGLCGGSKIQTTMFSITMTNVNGTMTKNTLDLSKSEEVFRDGNQLMNE